MLRRFQISVVTGAVLTLAVTAGCPSSAPPACDPTFFSAQAKGGFSPPSDHTGPVASGILLEWTAPGGSSPSFTFFTSPTTFVSSADSGDFTARVIIGLDSNLTIVRSEAIMLDSGQSGWLITFTDARAPGAIGVSVDLVNDGSLYRVRGFGNAQDATSDFDALIAVARTLCAN
ncbi:MAG: hypothetical protein AB7Q17_16515 [Phycisphaerae bacterium]